MWDETCVCSGRAEPLMVCAGMRSVAYCAGHRQQACALLCALGRCRGALCHGERGRGRERPSLWLSCVCCFPGCPEGHHSSDMCGLHKVDIITFAAATKTRTSSENSLQLASLPSSRTAKIRLPPKHAWAWPTLRLWRCVFACARNVPNALPLGAAHSCFRYSSGGWTCA